MVAGPRLALVSCGLGLCLMLLLAGCGGGSDSEATTLGAGQQALDAGPYILDLVARDKDGTGPAHLPKIEITVPEGWFNFDGWGLGKSEQLTTAVSFWSVASVYGTPCEWTSQAMVDPGTDVDSLASALAEQPLRNATSPRDVDLAGMPGKFLEWSVPTDIAFDEAHKAKALFPDCDDQTFQSWTANGWSGDRFQQAPGQVDRLWILDVNGERLVVDAYYLPETTEEDRAELEKVVQSIRFLE